MHFRSASLAIASRPPPLRTSTQRPNNINSGCTLMPNRTTLAPRVRLIRYTTACAPEMPDLNRIARNHHRGQPASRTSRSWRRFHSQAIGDTALTSHDLHDDHDPVAWWNSRLYAAKKKSWIHCVLRKYRTTAICDNISIHDYLSN